MTPIQRKFLAKLKARMEGAPEKDIADYVQNELTRHPQNLWDCLEAFMTVSAKYGIERKSMSVYWGVASLAMVRDPYFALEFEYRSRPEADNEWSKRFAALPKYQRDEALSTIEKQKRKASSLDYRRLDRLKEADEDVEAAKKAKPPPDKRKLSKEAKKFLKAFHKYMSIKTKPARLEFDKVLESLKGAQLEACLDAYIHESDQYAPTDTHSLYTFFALSSQAMHRCSGYLALKFQDWIKPETKSTYAKLYANLDGNQLSQLANDFAYINKRTRILDELRYAYYKANAKDPDDRTLRDFEAVKDDELRREVSGTLAEYDSYCERNDLRGFSHMWDGFATLMEEKDRLTLAMMVKWCRDWLSGDRIMRDELYWHAVGMLFVRLLLDRRDAYDRGYNDEEKAYLISPNKDRHPYLDDFERRLRYLWTTRQGARFSDFCKVHAALFLYGGKRNMRLATMSETETVLGNVERVEEHGPSPGDVFSVPVTQREGLLKDRDASVSIGESFGDITIVWFDGRDTAYVECRGLEKVLFVLHETDYGHQLGDLTNARFYDKVYEDTKGLLELIPIFFQVLSFLPDLVSGGLVGLAKSIALQYLITEGTEAVLGDSEAAPWVASAISMGTGHFTQTESAATRNITAELRAAEALEHGALSAHGFTLHGEHADVGVGGTHLGEKGQVLSGADELATLELTPVVTREKVTTAAVDAPAGSRIEPEGFDPKRAAVHDEPALKLEKIGEFESSVQHELLAAERGKGTQSAEIGEGTSSKQPPKRKRSTAPTKKQGRERTGGRGTGDRATGAKGKRRQPLVTMFATIDFIRKGIRYRFEATLEAFEAVRSFIATRYQVYVIRNAKNDVVYVGIVGGKTRPRNVLDRLQEHLVTKYGEFIGDADKIQIVGADLDERVARALEDSLIDQHNPQWNNRARDPESYLRKYGEKPSLGDVQAAHNTFHEFKIVIRQ